MPSSPSCCYSSDENHHRSPTTSCWYCPFNNQSIRLELSLFHWERFVIDSLAPLSKSKLDYVAPNYWHLCWLIWLIFLRSSFRWRGVSSQTMISLSRQKLTRCVNLSVIAYLQGVPKKRSNYLFLFWTLFWPFFDLLMTQHPTNT